MTTAKTYKSWLEREKYNGNIIEVGNDYLTADGRVLVRIWYKSYTLWGDLERGFYYQNLEKAYYDSRWDRMDLNKIIRSVHFSFANRSWWKSGVLAKGV